MTRIPKVPPIHARVWYRPSEVDNRYYQGTVDGPAFLCGDTFCVPLRTMQPAYARDHHPGTKRTTVAAAPVNRLYLRPPRQFKTLLFMGNGTTTERECTHLHDRIEYAMSVSSGMQQGVRKGTLEYKEGTKEIEDVIRDVTAALLGRHVSFGRLLPYPERDR